MAVFQFHSFFYETIWLTRLDSLPWFKRVFYKIARIGFIVAKGFTDERLNQQASALTYVSFLSIIPLMAVLFSLAKGFGFQGKVGSWVRESLSLIDPEILEQIINYVSNTQVTALGSIGFLVLLWTILKTLLYLERSFNQIWGVHHYRPLYRALAYYLSVVLIVPLLVAASTTFMAVLHTGEGGWLNWAEHLP
ncbi:MAG: YhjD/YihY/BrkB family envelope integrity protein, partial [Planctomycetota bacterium]